MKHWCLVEASIYVTGYNAGQVPTFWDVHVGIDVIESM
jgi:hypothetical protein